VAFRYGSTYTVEAAEYDLKYQELRHVVKRTLSSLSKLVELRAYFCATGVNYLDPDIFCGHHFQLRVFGEVLRPRFTLKHWLRFLSEQPGLLHWRPNIIQGHTLDPDVLPLLTSAHVNSPALNVFTYCPMIRALRVERWTVPVGRFCDELLMLDAFKCRLTSLSLGYFDELMEELKIVKSAVPNINFLGLRRAHTVSPPVHSSPEFY
jgi:hypothetical protein